ncbi:pyrroloquinoline quinone biosynthesis protein PqqE [Zavarzinia sp. CC-PAN008]|uniref:pyrroloquinoline quinone biosynthesis protein PqqE n=1 Tax=Zavarzinia sp. CC-PAN008 TaxID=3243332 RepID=UPI003F745EA4
MQSEPTAHVAPRAPTFEPPMALLAELTHRCPLQCPYCSNPLDLERASAELSTAEWLDVMRQATRMGLLQIHFSGGEPTVRRDLEDLVRGAAGLGLYSNLITSGVLADEARVHRLADAGLDHVQLSIQDSDPAGNDRIGNLPGALTKKLDFAGWVRAAGLPLTLNAVVHRQNLEHLPAMIDLALATGSKRLEVAHVQYYGWALRNRAALMPTRAQLEAATAIVDAARRDLKGRLVIDYVVPDYYAKRPKACMGGWARRFLNVAPDGMVLPCHAAESITGLAFESVRDRPLAEIWADSPAFQAYRGTDWMPATCRACEHAERDWGGCRCQAFAISGRADAIDPACALSPDHALLVDLAESESAKAPPAFTYRRIGAG